LAAKATSLRSPDEREADEVADQAIRGILHTPFSPVESPRLVERSTIGLQGRPLDLSLRSLMEPRLGTDLSGVRVHTGAPAAHAAEALSARAFSIGPDIAFSRGHYDPGSATGRHLIAHELAHTLQPSKPGPARILRQPDPDVLDATAPAMPQPPVIGPDYVIDLKVEDPRLPGERRDEQQFSLPVQIASRCDLRFWVVPITKLDLPPATTPPPATQVPPAVPPPPHPDVAVGTVVSTIDGAKLTALASTPEHIITAEYTKFAVGAASTSALKLRDGSVIIIDAGVNSRGMGVSIDALEQLTMDRLEAFIGDAVIRDLLISHAHADHFSLAARIVRKFPVQDIRMNDIMRRWAGSKEGRRAIRQAQADRIAEAEKTFREAMEPKRADWEAKEGAAFPPDARAAEWSKHVRQEFLKTPAAQGATERVLVQSKGNILDVIDFDLGTGARKAKMTAEGKTLFEAEDPYLIEETQRPIDSKRVLDRRRQTLGRDIDPNASAFVISVKGGVSLLVLPDLRAHQLKDIKDNFQKAMGSLERPVQIWDATHHMQKGWYNVAGTATASQLSKIVDFLWTFRAKKSDAVIVSAQANLADPKAPTLVDPVNLWLLRSLGFEVYLATSGREIRAIDITTAAGTPLTGIIGGMAPGEGPADLTIRRAKAALDKLAAERQAQQAALRDETDKTKRSALRERIKAIEGQETNIKRALKETLAEGEANLRQPKPTTASLAKPRVDSFPKQKALVQLLERGGFDIPVTSGLRLSEAALVILNRPPDLAKAVPGSPAARARDLADVRSRINEIGQRIKNGAPVDEVRVELLTEYGKYEALLRSIIEPPDASQRPAEGTERTLLQEDLQSVKAKMAELGEIRETTTYSRSIGQGDLLAQHVTVIRPLPTVSPALAKARALVEEAGKVGGLVMIATTVLGETDLVRRWTEGKATGAETLVGTAHSLTSGIVAVRMLKGLKVSPGVFVVLAIMEVGEAWFRHYDTQEQKDIAVLRAEVSAAIGLACMAIGQAIMMIPHPIATITGFLVMTFGPIILDAIFGERIANWAERRRSLNPGAVVEVLQKLRKLIKQYEIVVGSSQLAKRAADVSDPTMRGMSGAGTKAAAAQDEAAKEASNLEIEILDEFKDAYEDAKTNYAGLKDLDGYRAHFYYLRHEAQIARSGPTPSAEDAARAKLLDDTFKAIDLTMSIDSYTAEQIRGMSQWSKLDDELADLFRLVYGENEDDFHSKVRDKDKRVQAMVDNARYRLNPAENGVTDRAAALLKPGSETYRAYVDMLETREWRLEQYRRHYIERTSALCGVTFTPTGQKPDAFTPLPLKPDWVLSIAEGSIKSFRINIEHGFAPPPDLVAAVYKHADGTERYKQFVKDHPAYARDLERFETTERMIEGQLVQATRSIQPQTSVPSADDTKRLDQAEQDMKSAHTTRIAKQGKIYLSELDSLQRQVWQHEVEQAQALFSPAERSIRALTPEEELALTSNRSDFSPDSDVRPPIGRRLSIVRSPTSVDPAGNLMYIFRLTGDVPLNLRLEMTKPTKPVTISENALVGVVAAGNRLTLDGSLDDKVRVVPLNPRAIDVFGGVQILPVWKYNLSPVRSTELQRALASVAQEEQKPK
jgi:hypothetical protein